MLWGSVLVLIGLLFLGAAVLGWKWFRNLVKVRLTYQTLGETGAAVFYAVLGVAATAMGILTLIGVV